MHKIYLYKVKIPKGIGALHDALDKCNEDKFSFSITAFNSKILEVKCYEKIQNKISFFSPDGEKQLVEYESYQNINFSFFKNEGNYYLAISNPPRSVRNFFNLLSKIIGIGYTIEPVEFDINKISEHFFHKYQSNIKYVSIEKYSLNQKSYANIEVFSTENAISDSEKFVKNHNLKINKVSLQIKNLISSIDLTINKKGCLQTRCLDKSLTLSENEVLTYIHEILLIQSK